MSSCPFDSCINQLIMWALVIMIHGLLNYPHELAVLICWLLNCQCELSLVCRLLNPVPRQTPLWTVAKVVVWSALIQKLACFLAWVPVPSFLLAWFDSIRLWFGCCRLWRRRWMRDRYEKAVFRVVDLVIVIHLHLDPAVCIWNFDILLDHM
jgi:hypothetical protein